ncbi:MAG: carbohydrate-binding domain-containing protein [Lachnospira sp.]|nr:carbohydrate-binding domain-containing protein [Lachnospira sp.]
MINLKKVNKSCVAAVILAMCLMTSGCGSQNYTTNNKNTDTTVTSSITAQDTNVTHADDADNYKTEITGEFSITSTDGSTITQNDSVYTITQAGEYTVTGLLSEGQIVVNADDNAEITIVLNGTSITCSNGSPIYIKNADNVKIKSEENTYNCIVDARAEADDNSDNSSSENGNAAIYAACDLKLVGKGALSATGNYNNGIQSKDDISIKNVTIKVNAVNNAIKGNDEVAIESGEIIAISRKGDGIKTSNSSLSTKEKQKGNVIISGGNIDIYAACDGIDAAYGVDVSGDGNLNIYTDTYSDYSEAVAADTSGSSASSSGSPISTPDSSASNPGSSASNPGSSASNPGSSASNPGSSNQNQGSSSKSSSNATMMTYTTTANTDNQNNSRVGTPPDMNNAQNNGNMGNPPDMNNSSSNSDNNPDMKGNFGGRNRAANGMPGNNSSGNSSKKSYSTKGIKAESEINISGAAINISSTDDGILANSDSGVLETGEDGKGIISISGGTITISTGDDGIHADKELNITDGYINVLTSYEGLEAITINISGGQSFVYAADDGINACTGDGTSTPLINITGGYVDVTTGSGDTDGIDSNGNYTQSGGMVLVKGGSSSGQVSGSIDVDGNITITGGTCVALGGICETPVNSVNAYVFSSVSFNAGSYSVKDSSGNEIISFTLNNSYSNGWICTSALTTNTEYTLYCDGSSLTNWTQSAGTMGASNAGGFGSNPGGFNGGGRGGNMNGGKNMNDNRNINGNNTPNNNNVQ